MTPSSPGAPSPVPADRRNGGRGPRRAEARVSDRGVGYTVHHGHHGHHGTAAGPVVLLANSLGAVEDSWRELLAALDPEVTVLTHDTRGHGRTAAPEPFGFDDLVADAVDVLDHAGVAKALWCGVSLGGMLGVAAAARHPDRIRGLVALSAPARQENPEFWRERAADVRERGMSVATDGVAGRWFCAPFRDAEPARVEEVVGQLAALDPHGYAATCEAMAPADVLADAARTQVAAVFVAGHDDLAVPPRHSTMLAEATAGARLVEIDGGHMLGVEHPQLVAGLVHDLLGEPR